MVLLNLFSKTKDRTTGAHPPVPVLAGHGATAGTANGNANGNVEKPLPPVHPTIYNTTDPSTPRPSHTQTQSRTHLYPYPYPWSIRHLTLQPPSLIPKPGVRLIPPTTPSASPFPRYGPTLVSNPSNGSLILFGGLLGDKESNDLYVFSTPTTTADHEDTVSVPTVQVSTTGNIPSPRVGHSSALIGSVLIVWGGDTQTSRYPKTGGWLDDGLYLLNLITREWTKAQTIGPVPPARYGHKSVMAGTVFFVFGGQVGGMFFDDLWGFDLQSLRTTATWTLYEPASGSKKPGRRTGHTCISYKDEQLIIFGGTNSKHHYSDTWSFNIHTRTWTQLPCTGYIPAPREGHTAVLVGEVMYVFGGRGGDGGDLGDVAAFDVPNMWWYKFKNTDIGPTTPNPRSGHAMVAMGSKIILVGGESASPAVQVMEDPEVIHVLDTGLLVAS